MTDWLIYGIDVLNLGALKSFFLLNLYILN